MRERENEKRAAEGKGERRVGVEARKLGSCSDRTLLAMTEECVAVLEALHAQFDERREAVLCSGEPERPAGCSSLSAREVAAQQASGVLLLLSERGADSDGEQGEEHGSQLLPAVGANPRSCAGRGGKLCCDGCAEPRAGDDGCPARTGDEVLQSEGWRRSVRRSARRACEAPCTAAHTPPPPLTLQHLVACPRRAAIVFRARLRASITAELATSPCTAAWLRSNGRKELGAMLLSLFPIAAGTSLAEQQLHSTRLMCGVFTRRQARAAGRSLWFATAEDGLPPLIKLRMQCLEHCNTFFSHRKERAIAACLLYTSDAADEEDSVD